MVAHAGRSRWATVLEETLAPLPLTFHWRATGEEAIGLASTRRMHVAVVDEDLPDVAGRRVVRSIRELGLELPCLLVCRDPDDRLLRDALRLDVFSVLEAEAPRDLLPPTLVRLVRRFYEVDWQVPGGSN